MATARKKQNKKKAAKRKSTKRKAAKRKVASRSKKRSKKLKRVPQKDYEIVWDAQRESCHFGHAKKRIGGEIGSGVNDVIEVYTDGVFYYVLSLNFTENYACVEAFDGEPGGCAFLCFATPEDIQGMFNEEISQVKPSDVMEVMLEEYEERLED